MGSGAMMITAPGAYVQERGVLRSLGHYCRALGCSKAYLILGGTAYKTYRAQIMEGFAQCAVFCVASAFGGECCESEIARHAIALQGADVVVGVGGGKVLDTAKAVAYRTGARVVIAPTVASTDAPCSRISVLYTADGTFERYLWLRANPDMVVVDTEVIAEAPARLLAAGMGDAMATWYEADACRRSGNMAVTGARPSRAALALARLCRDTLLEHGAAAYEDVGCNRCSDALEAVVEANTYLSGVGFESGGLAAAHAIHNGMTVLPQTHGMLHGEKVAFGVLAQLVLEAAPVEEFRRIQAFFRAVHLPVTLAQLGLGGCSHDDLMRLARAACAADETMQNMPGGITPEQVVLALRTADCMGGV